MRDKSRRAAAELRVLALVSAAYGGSMDILIQYMLSVMVSPLDTTGTMRRFQVALALSGIVLAVAAMGYLIGGLIHQLVWMLSSAIALSAGVWILEHRLGARGGIPEILLWLTLPTVVGLGLVLFFELAARFPSQAQASPRAPT